MRGRPPSYPPATLWCSSCDVRGACAWQPGELGVIVPVVPVHLHESGVWSDGLEIPHTATFTALKPQCHCCNPDTQLSRYLSSRQPNDIKTSTPAHTCARGDQPTLTSRHLSIPPRPSTDSKPHHPSHRSNHNDNRAFMLPHSKSTCCFRPVSVPVPS